MNKAKKVCTNNWLPKLSMLASSLLSLLPLLNKVNSFKNKWKSSALLSTASAGVKGSKKSDHTLTLEGSTAAPPGLIDDVFGGGGATSPTKPSKSNSSSVLPSSLFEMDHSINSPTANYSAGKYHVNKTFNFSK